MAVIRVRVDGLELAIDDQGIGELPLVLVHGYTGFRQDFEGQWPKLAPLTRVLSPDLRGHGESDWAPKAEDYTLAAIVADLIGMLDTLGIERCHLLGHSMGGMAALRLALAHPDRLASLVLMDTSAAALDFVDLELLEKACHIGVEAGMPALASILRSRAAADPKRRAPDRRVEQEWGEERFWGWRDARIAAMDPAAYAGFGRELVECGSLVARLAEIRCPTLVMVGALDSEFLEPSELLAREIPDAQLAVLADAGHQPQNEAPEAWLAALAAHLERARA